MKTIFTLILLLVSFMTTASVERKRKVEDFFTNLDANNISLVDSFYDKDAFFVDPLGEHKGVQSIRGYYQGLYKYVESISFEYKDHLVDQNKHSLVWDMRLKASFYGKRPIVVSGTSILHFNDKGMVEYHRDFFDLGSFVYEYVPVLGSLIKFVKNKMKENAKK